MFRLNRNKQKTNRNSYIYLSSRPLIHFIPYPLILRTRFRKEISISLIQQSHATIETCSAKRAGSNRPLTFQNMKENSLRYRDALFVYIYRIINAQTVKKLFAEINIHFIFGYFSENLGFFWFFRFFSVFSVCYETVLFVLVVSI